MSHAPPPAPDFPLPTLKHPLIAFTGYAGTGKDEAARVLVAAGYHGRAFGDIIKEIFDPLCQRYAGFSAFTTDRTRKAQIREMLVKGGNAFYDHVFARYFSELPMPCVNPRLMRVREGLEWKRRGGLII